MCLLFFPTQLQCLFGFIWTMPAEGACKGTEPWSFYPKFDEEPVLFFLHVK